ncbi:MAG: DUF4149 domain-containing protein [Acidobacteria bacterium]|nr:DUF4149 domain-containing protein [Acidobacteriota bacterium]
MDTTVGEPETLKPATGASFGLGAQFLAAAELLLIGLWLGSMAFFSFALAPSAFAVLPSRHLAGLIVGNTLLKLEMIGLVVGVLLVLLQILKTRVVNRRGLVNFLLLLVMLATTAALRFWISPAMNTLRQAMNGEIDNVPMTDPTRIQFNDLHQYSVRLMGITLVAGLALLFFTVRSWLLSAQKRNAA